MTTELALGKKMSPEELQQLILADRKRIFDCTQGFLSAAYPAYDVNNNYALNNIEENSKQILENMIFFRVASCTIEKTDDVAEFFHGKMRKLLSAAYSSANKVCFGFIGRKEQITLILGIDPCQRSSNSQSVKDIAQGILPGIMLDNYKIPSMITPSWWGMMEAIPSVKIEDEKQKIDYTGLLRSLNGREFNFFIIARPIPVSVIQEKIATLLNVETDCSQMLKRNISLQSGESDTKGTTQTSTDTKTYGFSASGAPIGAALGAWLGSGAGGVGALPGALVGATIGAGFNFNMSKSHSDSLSTSISKTISENKSMSFDIQNYFAKELLEYADDAVSRLKTALAIGGWDTLVTYSAKDAQTLDLIQGYIFSDIAKPDKKKLPARIQALSETTLKSEIFGESKDTGKCELLFPKGFWSKDYRENKISAPLNSDELGMLFSFPESSAPGFELREGKFYSLSADSNGSDECRIGNICDGERIVPNADFSFSRKDINKHTFICGITGCGKTNSVKKILQVAQVPFLVLECAKKEYRNMDVKSGDLTVYTPGHPEIHSPQFNPFYIQPGVSLQTHIDYLKDLFNASFSFYGPMTYILESCLQRIYVKKGWNTTTGDHPLLVNADSIWDRYNADFIRKKYGIFEHRFLFPTMQDLLDEVKVYIETELSYDSEVSGNIKSAMIARLDGLCAGAKGYMFNNSVPADMNQLLSRNTVLELEGLSDDSDKAFSVGLLIIFINEYRQYQRGSADGLKHILVIEEAHRLLKNVSTERASENIGNPKGKAVEHFTNMLAEMRSYGQGVIIAEQIPSKISPDVIKNSSNKIIHRLVSKDDQDFMANTIGVKPEDSIYFGTQKPGVALCHKEGMYTPVSVKIDVVDNKQVSDETIREKAIKEGGMDQALLVHQIKALLPADIDVFIFKLLNSLLWYSSIVRNKKKPEDLAQSLSSIADQLRAQTDKIRRECLLHKIGGTNDDIRKAIATVLAEKIISLLCVGVYVTDSLPEKLSTVFSCAFEAPDGVTVGGEPLLFALTKKLADFDKNGNLAVSTVTELAIKAFFEQKQQNKTIDRRKLVESYFLSSDDTCITTISRRICERYANTEVM